MKNSPEPKINTPGIIILQWLTYAFWGWFVLATSLLAVTVLSHFIAHTNDSNFTPYAIAAVLVLLPLSFVCNFFYSKQEPDKKTGAASIIMIIHAVLFALFCIGAFIAIVISLVQFVISGSDTTTTQIALFSEIIVAILYVAVFLRTLHPAKPVWFRKLFSTIMTIVAGIILVLGIFGPLAGALLTRDDILIDNNLSNIQHGIDNYVSNQNKLPDNLGSIDLIGDAKTIVDRNLVKYVPNSKPSVTTPSTFNPKTSTTTYYYELCVNYKEAIDNNNIPIVQSYPPIPANSDGYSSYVSTANHPAGDHCYKVSSSPIYLTKPQTDK